MKDTQALGETRPEPKSKCSRELNICLIKNLILGKPIGIKPKQGKKSAEKSTKSQGKDNPRVINTNLVIFKESRIQVRKKKSNSQ